MDEVRVKMAIVVVWRRVIFTTFLFPYVVNAYANFLTYFRTTPGFITGCVIDDSYWKAVTVVRVDSQTHHCPTFVFVFLVQRVGFARL